MPPAWRPAPSRPRWDSRPPERSPLGFTVCWLGSLLAHVLLALALYFWPDPRRPQDALPPPSFDVVFEGGQPEQPEAEPAEGVPDAPQPEPPATADVPPPPEAPPQPGLPPPPPPQEALPQPPAPPPPSPVPAPPVPSPPVQQALPLPPPPEPPPVPPVQQALPLPPAVLPPMEPTPVPPEQGTVELLAPPTELRLPDRLAETLPPPPPPPPAPPQPQQRPSPPAQQAQPPRPNLPGIWAPGGIQLGRPPTPPAGRPQARGLDLTVDPRMMEGRASRDPSVRVSGAQVGADWRAAFRRWLDQNIHYPQQAIIRGEDGQVRVRITASADGTVRNVQLVGPSTSPSLNWGTTYPFNGARLPRFPPGSEATVTIDLTVNYVLLRGR